MRHLFWGTLCGLCITVLTGCVERQSAEQPEGQPGKLVVAVIPKSTGAEFWETVEEGAREAAREVGVQMKWEGILTETKLAEQNKIIENMINLGVDGIALAPLNHKVMRKSVENAVDTGVPVVIFAGWLAMNAQAPFGEVLYQWTDLESQPLEGFTFDDWQPFSGDSLHVELRWRDRPADQLVGRIVRLEVRFREGRIYAVRGDFHFIDAQDRFLLEDGQKIDTSLFDF